MDTDTVVEKEMVVEEAPTIAFPSLKLKKLAIVGWATPTRDMVPHDDASFEIWGCNEMAMSIGPERRFDAWFNFHDRIDQNPIIPREMWDKPISGHIKIQNIEWLKQLKVPVYMLRHHDDIPTSVAYPLHEVLATFGREAATSAISYMLALGIMKGFKEIHVYGVDMKLGSEYEYQRTGCLFLIGNALGRGINIRIAEGSPLMNVEYLYGYEQDNEKQGIIKLDFLQAIHRKLTEEHGKAMQATNTLNGAKDQVQAIIDILLLKMKEIGLPTGGVEPMRTKA